MRPDGACVGEKKVAMVPADVLAGLMETAHLLRSPKTCSGCSLRCKGRLVAREGRNRSRSSAESWDLPRSVEREAIFHPEFRWDLRFWVATDRKVALRALELVESVLRHPYTGIGKPEPLKYGLAGCWSRRITQDHRLVYRVSERRIDVLQARDHY
jgi:toxin YoeB